MAKTDKYIYAKGGRKTATSTIRLYESEGVDQINGKPLTEVYPGSLDQKKLYYPFRVLDLDRKKFHFTVRVKGSGVSAQLDASVHALSKALVKMNEDYRKPLKKLGLLTRDPRMVERKTTGNRKARKTEQYSKR